MMDGELVVIGSGIVGVAIAREAQQSGVDTLLVERDLYPQGASAASFASLSAFDEPDRDIYLLKTNGIVGWRQWEKEFGSAIGARFAGELRWAESKDAALQLTSLFERASRRGYPVNHLSKQDILKQVPAAEPGEVLAATWAPEDGHADAERAIDALREAFMGDGGSLLVGRAGVLVRGEKVEVRVGIDRLETEKVVIAAGAETTLLLEHLGWDVPMEPSPGLLAVTERLEPFVDETVYVYPEGPFPIHLKQSLEGRVVIGERAQDEIARHPTRDHAERLLRQAQRYFPTLGDANLDHFTVAWRPMPRDRAPIVGPLPGAPTIYVATGHSGVTTAPALARAVVREIRHGSEVEFLRPFRPGRFAARDAETHRRIEEVFSGTELLGDDERSF